MSHEDFRKTIRMFPMSLKKGDDILIFTARAMTKKIQAAYPEAKFEVVQSNEDLYQEAKAARRAFKPQKQARTGEAGPERPQRQPRQPRQQLPEKKPEEFKMTVIKGLGKMTIEEFRDKVYASVPSVKKGEDFIVFTSRPHTLRIEAAFPEVKFEIVQSNEEWYAEAMKERKANKPKRVVAATTQQPRAP